MILAIFGVGALAVRMEYAGMDSTILMAYVLAVALVGVVLYGFRHPIYTALRRIGGLYERLEDGDYTALPEGHYDDPNVQWDDEEPDDQAEDSNIPVLHLAPTCPLPFSSALTHTLFLEHPAIAGRQRPVALRKYLELLSAHIMPFILFTQNPSYASLLSHCRNGWLAGAPSGKATAPQIAQGRYASVTPQNAQKFADKAMEIGAQIVFYTGGYESETEVVLIVSTILAELRARAVSRGATGAILAFAEAHLWLPDDFLLSQEQIGLGDDIKLAKKVREQLVDLVSTEQITGLFVYLATPSLSYSHIDLRAPRNCRLWLLNLPYSRLTPGDVAFVCYSTGLAEEDLACLEQDTILVDVESRQAMELQLYPNETTHEEPRAERSTDDLAALEVEESSLGEL
jgi:hypothetical protein